MKNITSMRIHFVLASAVMLIGSSGCSIFSGAGKSGPGAAAPPPSAAALAASSRKTMLAGAHNEFAMLQANAVLAALVPAEIKDADAALRTADNGQYDAKTGEHQIFVAARKVRLARVRAESRQLSSQLEALRAQRDALTGAAPATP